MQEPARGARGRDFQVLGFPWTHPACAGACLQPSLPGSTLTFRSGSRTLHPVTSSLVPGPGVWEPAEQDKRGNGECRVPGEGFCETNAGHVRNQVRLCTFFLELKFMGEMVVMGTLLLELKK